MSFISYLLRLPRAFKSFKGLSHFSSILVFIVAILLYAPTVTHDFVYDDWWQIVRNSAIQGGLFTKAIFLAPIQPGNIYRPITSVSFACDYQLFGFSAAGFRITNIVLHALVAALLVPLIRSINGERLAFVAALLFAVHPLHVEVVSSAFNRSESLALLFGVLATILMLREPARGGAMQQVLIAVGIVITTLGSVLSKESGVVFFVVPLLAVWAKGKIQLTRAFFSTRVAPLVAAALLYLVIRHSIFGAIIPPGIDPNPIDNPLVGLSTMERIANAAVLLADYVRLLIVPLHLSADYSWAKLQPVSEWLSPLPLMKLFTVMSLMCVIGVGFVKKREVAFWGVWFVLPFLVTGSFFFLNNMAFAERYAYAPSVAMCVALAKGVSDIKGRSLATILFALLFLSFMALAHRQSRCWRDDASLWSCEITRSPHSARTQYSYGYQLLLGGDYQGALKHIQTSLAIYPGQLRAKLLLHRLHLRLGQLSEAESVVTSLVAQYPAEASVYDAQGWLKLAQGDNEGAGLSFERAISLDPSLQTAIIGAFSIAVRAGNDVQALLFRQSITPNAKRDPRYREAEQVLCSRVRCDAP